MDKPSIHSRLEASRTRPRAPEYRAAWPPAPCWRVAMERGFGRGARPRGIRPDRPPRPARPAPAARAGGASSTSMIVPNSLIPRPQQPPVSRPAGAAPAPGVRRFYTMKSLYRDGPRTLQLGTGLICQQDGQSTICQDVLSCPAEYHLSQSALRVGTLDQKVTAQ